MGGRAWVRVATRGTMGKQEHPSETVKEIMFSVRTATATQHE